MSLQIGNSAHGSPCFEITLGTKLGCEVDKFCPIRRQIAFLFLNPTFEPLSKGETVRSQVPLNEAHDATWPATEDICCWRITCQNA
jgi:hypothetical protein